MLEFSEDALELIQSGQLEYILSERDGDYIQLIVFDDLDNIITKPDGTLAIFYSNKNAAGDIIAFDDTNSPEDGKIPQILIYRDTSNKVFIKPNEVLFMANIPTGNYKLKIDFLKNTFASDFETISIDEDTGSDGGGV